MEAILRTNVRTSTGAVAVKEITRGQIYFANFGVQTGSVQGGMRPCIVISNNKNNHFAPTVNVYPLSSKVSKFMVIHPLIGKECGLLLDSIVLTEQPRTLNKSDLGELLGDCTADAIAKIEMAMDIQQGRQKTVDYDYVNSLSKIIKQSIEMLKTFNNEFFVQSTELHKKELVNYCKQYNLNYSKIMCL